MTLRQFSQMVIEISTIVKLESGSDSPTQPRGLTGQAAHKAALRMFGKKGK